MKGEVWCNACKRNVIPQKRLNLLIFALIGGIFYLPYHYLIKKKKCPICGNHDFSVAKSQKTGKTPYKLAIKPEMEK